MQINIKFSGAGSLVTSVLFAVLMVSTPVNAATIVQCGAAQCSSSFSIFVDGSTDEVGGGQIWYDAETGDILLDVESNVRGGGFVNQNTGGLMWDLGDGSNIQVNSVFGNADPILGFSLGATTGAVSRTFSFAFDLPIAISGPIDSSSSVSYSLTSLTDAGAQIAPLIGDNVVIAQDVDTDIGGLPPLDKGVNVGDAFFFVGGPQTQNSPVYTASDSITGSLDYDLMSVVVAFSLSANSAVGLSGFVQQEEVVPVPAALPLLLSGLIGLGFISRRRKV